MAASDLHEEVFLTGIRIRGQAMAEARVEELLETALDGADLQLADDSVRQLLAAEWSADDSRLRTRLLAAMTQRADTRQQAVTAKLAGRRDADAERAREIFAAFRRNLADSYAALAAAEQDDAQRLFADDQQAQRRQDLRAMEERHATLDAEEQREIAAIEERYAEIKPHVSAAAVVFALTPGDAAEGWR